MSMREPTMMKMPALAVVGPDHRIVRSTEAFQRRCDGAEKICESLPELQQVLAGKADAATVNLGELSVTIEAMTDATGRRQAMLTLPPLDPSPTPEPALDALRDAADESPAVVWVTDLDGRHLYGNSRYEELDSDVSELDERPDLAMFPFALRDERGRPIATCRVAAPDPQTARAEAVHLMQLERWNRLDPVEIRTELLEQWRLKRAETISRPPEAAPVPAPPPTPSSPILEELQDELSQAKAAAARATEDAEHWRAEFEQALAELEQARNELAAARAEAEGLRNPSVVSLSLSEELGRSTPGLTAKTPPPYMRSS